MKGLKLWRIAGFVWLIFLGCAYFFPSDSLYAITIWPPFVWASFGFFAALPGIRKHRSKLQLLLLGAWMVLWLGFGEERLWLPNRFGEPSGGIRIVSLNCAGGSPEAAAEAFQSHPQLVLLQETPNKGDIEKVAGAGYSVHSGPDGSIATTGKLEPIPTPRGTSNFTAAIVTLPNLKPMLVVSLRLQPPIFRIDYWSPDCWNDYANNRTNRRKELQEVALWIRGHAGDMPVIAGGDFNTPPDKGTLAPLSDFLTEATGDSGYTAVNEFPMARIDQIWSRGFVPLGSRAYQTQNSDHQMVVCNLNFAVGK